MARANVLTQPIVKTGVEPELTAPTVDGDVIDTGRVLLMVDNAGASPVTVTVQTPLTVDGLAVDELAVQVPAGGRRLIGPFSKTTFGRPTGQPDSGRAYVDYSAVADVTRGVFSL
ncbi:hypothetical protein [Prauserella cavernicola]|uniref:Uncharacterized protein n=1 Tax=Prauserella cavernicola TaxID=2800127 RepID=A0A934QRA8_9PSEU|nr:hypothetical protein [Prauserella cavernicola]MBK1785135.1 hypothetical protein [Prauserella cavernicola]